MMDRNGLRKIQAFRDRFGLGHFHFACHAAFPIAFTPDLLYQLWANFQSDIQGENLGISWIAVSDLLLSGLCEEVGYELFEMPQPIRDELLHQLQQDSRLGKVRMDELAGFLLSYVEPQLDSFDADIRDSAHAHQIAALAYRQPAEAVQKIEAACLQLNQNDKIEQRRIASLLEVLSEPLQDYSFRLTHVRQKLFVESSMGGNDRVKKASNSQEYTKHNHQAPSETISSKDIIRRIRGSQLRKIFSQYQWLIFGNLLATTLMIAGYIQNRSWLFSQDTYSNVNNTISPSTSPVSQSEERPQPIMFKPGEISVILQGELLDKTIRSYSLEAAKGQILTVTIAGNPDVSINLLRSDGSKLDGSASLTRSWTGQLPANEQYKIQVVGKGVYSLDVAVTPLANFNGNSAELSLSQLISQLSSGNPQTQIDAIQQLSSMGKSARSAIPALTDLLGSSQHQVRVAVIIALSKLGQEAKPAVPKLAQLLADPDSDIRVATATTLGTLEANAAEAVPQLARALQNPDRNTRSFAASALGRIGGQAQSAVLDLTRLLKDLDKDVRSSAATALGRIGLEARSALPELVNALKDDNVGVRLNAAFAVGRIAGALQDKAAKLNATDLSAAHSTLETALPILEDPKASFNEDVINSVRRSLKFLKDEYDSRALEHVIEWRNKNPQIAFVLALCIASLVLWFSPKWIVKLTTSVKAWTSFFQNTKPFSPEIVVPSPDGKLVAVAASDGIVELQKRNGQLIASLSSAAGSTINGLNFSPNSQLLAAAGQNGMIYLWNNRGALLKTLTQPSGAVTYVSFNSDGQTMVSMSSDNISFLWNLNGDLLETRRH